MSVRRKLLGSAATIAIASMATIGGSFAYFSSTVETHSQFSNGTLVLAPSEPYLQSFDIVNFKPGDILDAKIDNQEPAMVLNNQGSLPMRVFAKIETSSDKGSINAIEVTSLKFGNEDLLAKYFPGQAHVTLANLASVFNKGNATVNNEKVEGVGKEIGDLFAKPASGEIDWAKPPIKSVTYELKFVDNGKAQNELQGDTTKLDFVFTGLQFDGKVINQTKLTNTGKPGGGGTYTRTDDINVK